MASSDVLEQEGRSLDKDLDSSNGPPTGLLLRNLPPSPSQLQLAGAPNLNKSSARAWVSRYIVTVSPCSGLYPAAANLEVQV